MLDRSSPDLVSNSPSNFVNQDDPDIDATFQDSDSGIVNATIEFKGEEDGGSFDGSTGEESLSIDSSDFDNLEEGEHTVSYEAYDEAGNRVNNSWSFTVDTSYDGDTSPSFDPEDERIFLLEDEYDDRDIEVNLDQESENSKITTACYDSNDNEIDSDTKEVTEDGTSFSCELDAGEYGGESVDMYVELCDEAGNCEVLDSSEWMQTYHMDLNSPIVSGLSIGSDAEMFNSDFDVEFIATDDASGVEAAEYFFGDDGPGKGEGEELNYTLVQESYEIDTSGLTEGEHTLNVRAKDGAERWSVAKSVDFSFDPDAQPEISLDVPEELKITAGESKEFDVGVENTGKIYVNELEVKSGSGDIVSSSKTVSDLSSGESSSVTFEAITVPEDMGEHKIEVSTDNPSIKKEIDLVIRANSDQRERLDSTLSDYSERMQNLRSNVTSLKEKLSEKRRQRLDSNFSEFEQNFQDAQEAIDNGNYYEAESILEGIDQDYATAQSSYSNVKEEHKAAQFRMYLILGIVGFLLVAGGAAAFFMYSEDYELDLEQLTDSDIDISRLEDIPSRIKVMFEKEKSEAEEFDWDGFN